MGKDVDVVHIHFGTGGCNFGTISRGLAKDGQDILAFYRQKPAKILFAEKKLALKNLKTRFLGCKSSFFANIKELLAAK